MGQRASAMGPSDVYNAVSFPSAGEIALLHHFTALAHTSQRAFAAGSDQVVDIVSRADTTYTTASTNANQAYQEEKNKHLIEVSQLSYAIETMHLTLDVLKRNPYRRNEDLLIIQTATRLAFDSAADEPSSEATNFAVGFIQYFEFEYPELVQEVAGVNDSDLFLWFMASDGATPEAKLRFAHALFVNLDRKVPAHTNYIDRFDTPVLSLEGYMWLRNFEQFDEPRPLGEINYESKNMRMERIAWEAGHMPERINQNALKEFNDLYARAHEIDKQVPDFAVMINGPRRRHAGVVEDVDDFPAKPLDY